MRIPRHAARLGLALALSSFLGAVPSAAAPGWSIEKIAIEGEATPGAADTFGELFDVTVGDGGHVALGAPMGSGFPAAGVWVDPGTGLELRMRDGDAAPAPIVGTYSIFASAVRLDASGRVAVPVGVSTGGGFIGGLFLDSSGADSVLAAEGDPATTPPGGSLDVALAEGPFFGMNAAGDVSFHSDVTGGSATTGIFVRSNAGGVTARALQGDLLEGGPDAFLDFGHPDLNAAGQVAFPATLSGGASTAALVLDSGGGPGSLVRDGDPAPNTGGGSFVDFLYPAINGSGQVAFLSNLSGGTASAGVFVARPLVVPVVLENQVVAGAGPVSSVGSVPNLSDDGAIALSLGFASGPVSSGVYVHDKGFDAVAVDGETAPDSGGALFQSFGMLSRNEDGQVAFVATLDDGRTGVYLATPTGAPHVPLPSAALAVTALGIALAARRRLR